MYFLLLNLSNMEFLTEEDEQLAAKTSVSCTLTLVLADVNI